MPEEKMVKESDLIAYKKSAQERERKLKEEIETINKRVAEAEQARRQAESQLKIARANVEDDEEV